MRQMRSRHRVTISSSSPRSSQTSAIHAATQRVPLPLISAIGAIGVEQGMRQTSEPVTKKLDAVGADPGVRRQSGALYPGDRGRERHLRSQSENRCRRHGPWYRGSSFLRSMESKICADRRLSESRCSQQRRGDAVLLDPLMQMTKAGLLRNPYSHGFQGGSLPDAITGDGGLLSRRVHLGLLSFSAGLLSAGAGGCAFPRAATDPS